MTEEPIIDPAPPEVPVEAVIEDATKRIVSVPYEGKIYTFREDMTYWERALLGVNLDSKIEPRLLNAEVRVMVMGALSVDPKLTPEEIKLLPSKLGKQCMEAVVEPYFEDFQEAPPVETDSSTSSVDT